jgi:hypothetical protein
MVRAARAGVVRERLWRAGNALLTGLVVGVSVVVGVGVGGVAAQVQRVPLRCRLAAGPWQDCVMRIEAVGHRWQLELAGQQVDFRHDGSGSVEMRRQSSGRWSPVPSRWSEEQALCWGDVCALGQFPLD